MKKNVSNMAELISRNLKKISDYEKSYDINKILSICDVYNNSVINNNALSPSHVSNCDSNVSNANNINCSDSSSDNNDDNYNNNDKCDNDSRSDSDIDSNSNSDSISNNKLMTKKTISLTEKTFGLSEITLSPANSLNYCMYVADNPVNKNFLSSKEFINKYSFFIKVIYACIKLNVKIFNRINSLTLKNNNELINSFNGTKKILIVSHIKILKAFEKKNNKMTWSEYETIDSDFLKKIRTINNIVDIIKKMVQYKIFSLEDNITKLITPFFIKKEHYIEEYY
jgi:hypothetical protein